MVTTSNTPYNHRPQEDPSKFIGPPKMTYNSFQERLNTEAQSDRDLFHNSAQNTTDNKHEFRTRNKKAEIHPDMVFTSNNMDSFKRTLKEQSAKY
jgi:hypothetical protein